jgi:hypothetical protein
MTRLSQIFNAAAADRCATAAQPDRALGVAELGRVAAAGGPLSGGTGSSGGGGTGTGTGRPRPN